MNRCLGGPNRTTHSFSVSFKRFCQSTVIALGTGLLFTSAIAQESVRKFPPRTERGSMMVTHPPELIVNGRAERLSPGARIRSADNLLLLSGQLAGQNYLVHFVRDSNGLIPEVWILTPAEAAQPLPLVQ